MQLGIKFAESDCRHVLPNPHLFWLLLDPSCYYHIPHCLSSPPHIKTKKIGRKNKEQRQGLLQEACRHGGRRHILAIMICGLVTGVNLTQNRKHRTTMNVIARGIEVEDDQSYSKTLRCIDAFIVSR